VTLGSGWRRVAGVTRVMLMVAAVGLGALGLTSCGSSTDPVSYQDGVSAVDNGTSEGSQWAADEIANGLDVGLSCADLWINDVAARNDQETSWIAGCHRQFVAETGG